MHVAIKLVQDGLTWGTIVGIDGWEGVVRNQ